MPPVQNNSTTPTHHPSQSQTAQDPRSVVPTRYAVHMGIPFPIRPVPLSQYPPLSGQQPPQTVFSAHVPSSLQHVVSSQEDPFQQAAYSQQTPPSHQVLPVNQAPLSQQEDFPPARGQDPASATRTLTVKILRERDPKLSRTPARAINLVDVNWGLVSNRCPYIHPTTGVRCPTASTQPVQWRLTRHAATHVFAEIQSMREGSLGYCQGTIVNSPSLFEKFRECWFFCDKCLLVKSQTARTAGIKLSMEPGTFMCDSCEEQYFAALQHFCRPR